MGQRSQAAGLLILLYAVAAFLVNFGIWTPWGAGALSALWNPFSLLTARIVGDIWLIGGGLAWFLNGVFAFFWTGGLLFVAGVLLLK